MSDSPRPPREWRFYIQDMMGFAEKCLAYTEGMDQQTFTSSGMTYDATLRNLELIGEAATHVPDDIRAAHPDIPWRMVIATRNRLIHAYLGIDEDTIWSIIRDDIPALITKLEEIPRTACECHITKTPSSSRQLPSIWSDSLAGSRCMPITTRTSGRTAFWGGLPTARWC